MGGAGYELVGGGVVDVVPLGGGGGLEAAVDEVLGVDRIGDGFVGSLVVGSSPGFDSGGRISIAGP